MPAARNAAKFIQKTAGMTATRPFPSPSPVTSTAMCSGWGPLPPLLPFCLQLAFVDPPLFQLLFITPVYIILFFLVLVTGSLDDIGHAVAVLGNQRRYSIRHLIAWHLYGD